MAGDVPPIFSSQNPEELLSEKAWSNLCNLLLVDIPGVCDQEPFQGKSVFFKGLVLTGAPYGRRLRDHPPCTTFPAIVVQVPGESEFRRYALYGKDFQRWMPIYPVPVLDTKVRYGILETPNGTQIAVADQAMYSCNNFLVPLNATNILGSGHDRALGYVKENVMDVLRGGYYEPIHSEEVVVDMLTKCLERGEAFFS